MPSLLPAMPQVFFWCICCVCSVREKAFCNPHKKITNLNFINNFSLFQTFKNFYRSIKVDIKYYIMSVSGVQRNG